MPVVPRIDRPPTMPSRRFNVLAASASPVPRLQSCAAEALRNIHTKETVPFLAPLLDSPDQTIRYYGLSGLASFTNSGVVPREPPLMIDGVVTPRNPSAFMSAETVRNYPTMSTFALNEASYLSFWKAWWTTNQVALAH